MDYNDEEIRLVKSILEKYDKDSLTIFTGDAARAFIRHASVSEEILGEIWGICDTQCKGFLTRDELTLFIRLLGYAQVDHDFRRPACRQKGTS
jgi:epidermal growth factor receptor substrate 15